MGFQFVPQVNTGRYPLLGAVQPWARYGGTIECVRRLAFLGNGAGDPHGMSIEEPTLLLRSPLTFGYTFASGNLTANATEGAMRAAMRRPRGGFYQGLRKSLAKTCLKLASVRALQVCESPKHSPPLHHAAGPSKKRSSARGGAKTRSFATLFTPQATPQYSCRASN